MQEIIKLNLHDDDYADLWRLASKARVKKVEVTKQHLYELLEDHSKLIAWVEESGVKIE